MKQSKNCERNVQEFWDWFMKNHGSIELAYSSGDTKWLNAHLTPRITRIESDLAWEIGPYNDPDNTLVVSPAIKNNLLLAERIVAAAPKIPAWHFLAAKPPKELNSLAMALPEVPKAEVCADDWVYRLTSYNNSEFFDMEVFTDVTPSIEDKHLQLLTHRLVESLVGERIYLDRIGAITIYRPTDPRSRERTTKFPLLYKHICDLLAAEGKNV